MRSKLKIEQPTIDHNAVVAAMAQLANAHGILDPANAVEARRVLGVYEVTYVLIAANRARLVLTMSIYQLTGQMPIGDTGVWVLCEGQVDELLRRVRLASSLPQCPRRASSQQY